MPSKLKNITLSLTSGTAAGSDLIYVGSSSGDADAKMTLAELAAFVGSGVATAEIIRDVIGAALLQAAGVTITVNDGLDTITIGADTEAIQDIIGALISAASGVNGGIVVTYDDAGNAVSIGLASSAFQTLTDAATIAWDMSAGYNAKVTLGGNRTAGAPTNPVEGRTYSLLLTQDGTGSRTWTPAASMKFGAAGNPTLSTGAGKKDMVFLQCIDSVTPEFRCTFNKDA
jgi:hypothetical protein